MKSPQIGPCVVGWDCPWEFPDPGTATRRLQEVAAPPGTLSVLQHLGEWWTALPAGGFGYTCVIAWGASACGDSTL